MTALRERILAPPKRLEKLAGSGLGLNRTSRSILELFAYAGPALIASMAYMDPGNYGTDIQAGALLNYGLLWTVGMANLMAMLLQYLSGKIGIATGKDLPELVRGSLNVRGSLRSKFDIYLHWIGAEVAAAATDLAEYLGTVIALNILFNVPLLYASIFGAADILILLALTSRRFRVLEYFFMLILTVIGFGFLYEIAVTGLDITQIANSFVHPAFGTGSITLIVGIIGATVMPHALYVHSTLTKNKLVNRNNDEKKRLLKLHTRESVFAFTIAGMVNAAILVVSAISFYPKFSDVSAVDQAYRIMIPLYGSLAAIVFAVTLLCSGLASSTTGTIAGQAIMDGLLGTKVNKTARRVITRVVNVFPTTIAVLLGIDPLSLLVYSQVLLSLMIALPMIPLITYTAKKEFMGPFVNKRLTTFLAVLSGTAIISLNTYLIYYLVASLSIYLQATILGAYGVYHLYLAYATW